MTDLDIIHKAIIESKGCKGDDFPYEYIEYSDIHCVFNPEDWEDTGEIGDPFWVLDKSILIPNLKTDEPYILFAIVDISYKEETESLYLHKDDIDNILHFDNVFHTGYLFDIVFDRPYVSIYIEAGSIKPTSPLYINISKLIAIKADGLD